MERNLGIARTGTRAARGRLLQLLGSVALVALLAACGGGGPDEGAVPSTSTTVGAAGGTVVGPDDLRIVVPPGALSTDTVITVRKSGVGAPALPASVAASAPSPAIYELSPHGLTFDAPVTISLPSTLDPSVNPVLMAQPDAEWELVNATADAGRVSWTTTHFSWTFNYPCGASYPPGTPLPPNGPPGCQFPSSGVLVNAQPAAAMVPVAIDQYRVTDAADVTVKFSYSAPLDCINPAIKTWRFKRPATAPASVTTTPVILTQTPTRIPGASRLTGTTDVPFRFEYADNGNHVMGFFFACQGGITVGGNVLFTVAAPQPPAMPAAPTITQQPVNTIVLAGATATLDVLATAPDNLAIRWERKEPAGNSFAVVSGAAPITGGSRLGVVTVAGDTGASYRAQVCNTLRGVDNCVYTNVVTLTVTLPPPPPGSLSSPARLSGATQSACGISSAGGALCWGANTSGELGRGSNQPAEGTPAAATGLTGVTSIAASSFIACATHGAGSLSCWGGYPGTSQFELSTIPVRIAGVTDAKLVRVANGTVCTVDGDKRIRCLGDAGPLQIDGHVVEDAIDVAFISGGRCVLLVSGDARCATYDSSASLVTTMVVPMVRSLGGTPGFSGLGTPFCVVLQSASVRCWGSNGNGQLGTGNADMSVTDVTVAGVTQAIQVAVGTRHACALSSGGTVSCWGSGYLGNGAGVETTRAPSAVGGLSNIVEIAAGYDATCALRTDGVVLCWGDNAVGSIGTGALGGAVLVPTPTAAGAAFMH